MKQLVLILLTFTLCLSYKTSAQTTETPEANPSNSLSDQFNWLKEKSNSYQEYKVIKITSLNSFWKNINDSLNVARKQYGEALSEIQKQTEELKKLKEEIVMRDKNIAGGEYEKAHITVLGIDMKKENYIYLSWSIIGLLILLITIGYFKYSSSEKTAYNKTKDYESINNELNDFKQKAREKELKMGRELQTERNKVEELNQKIVSLKKQVHL